VKEEGKKNFELNEQRGEVEMEGLSTAGWYHEVTRIRSGQKEVNGPR